MGMAASQARFLGLTARKTNTEYEGQQVNQQRTALANESAGLFNQMLALEVPTPPSATNYYSIRYTYSDDGQDYEILSQTPQSNGTYRVKTKVTYAAEVATKYLLSGTYKIDEGEKDAYTYNGYKLISVNDDALQEEIGAASNVFWRYQNEESDYYFIKDSTFQEIKKQMEASTSKSWYGTSEQYIKTAGQKTKYETIDNATFDSDSSGRLTKIHYTKEVDDTTGTGGKKTISVDKDLTMTEVEDPTG